MKAEPKILESQVRAAGTLFDALPAYKATENALNVMAERFPDDNPESCLLKRVAINALLSTNLFDIVGMAEHVHRTLDKSDRDGEELVDRIARFDGFKLSFASKYAHFFLDSTQYPICDQYVLKAMARHLGRRSLSPTSYMEFASRFEEVQRLCESRFGFKEMDRYLWLAGVKRSQDEKGDAGMSKDVKALFASEESRIRSALAELN